MKVHQNRRDMVAFLGVLERDASRVEAFCTD